ncbi:MFS general substrate transporter [Amylocystis lapponica]|nr:MFS general substrate transporter [Amylocystis lapponica]
MAKIERIVFLSLVLDLFAFTIPLPLFPRIIEWYTKRESSDPTGFLSQTLYFVSTTRGLLYQPTSNPQRWDIVFLGLMGFVFSALQWLVSPYIGSLSDKYGRKRVLLVTMLGNILSALVWVKSTTFASYMLSRVIGGFSEGNVQLAIAILSDVSTPENRAKSLAYVGIAFAICFCIGPPIGAYFASRPLPASITASGFELNVYATPAMITVVLLVLETIFLAFVLPETRGKRAEKQSNGTTRKSAVKDSTTDKTPKQESVQKRLATLGVLRRLHFLFLGIFSGVEFTLTFLTFDRTLIRNTILMETLMAMVIAVFDWNNKQNGALIGSIGVISALLQGGYVRRAIPKIGEGAMAQRGIASCALGLVLLALLPHALARHPDAALRLLQGAAVCMAFTSATVVNALTAHASLQCDDAVDGDASSEHPLLAKGKALGQFRSSGQLGRAMGPLLACASYWTFGPSTTYAVSAAAMFALATSMGSIARRRIASA